MKDWYFQNWMILNSVLPNPQPSLLSPPSLPLWKCLDLVFPRDNFSRQLWRLSFPISSSDSTASINKHVSLLLV